MGDLTTILLKLEKIHGKVVQNAKATGELASHVADLDTSIRGEGGLSERVTRVETKLSERTSTPAPGRRKKLQHAGIGGGVGAAIAGALVYLATHWPW